MRRVDWLTARGRVNSKPAILGQKYAGVDIQRLKVGRRPSEEPVPQSDEGQTKRDPDRSARGLSGPDEGLRCGLAPNFSEASVNVALCLPLIHPHRVVLLSSRGLYSHKIETWTSGLCVFSMPSTFPAFQQYALCSQKTRQFFGRRPL